MWLETCAILASNRHHSAVSNEQQFVVGGELLINIYCHYPL